MNKYLVCYNFKCVDNEQWGFGDCIITTIGRPADDGWLDELKGVIENLPANRDHLINFVVVNIIDLNKL